MDHKYFTIKHGIIRSKISADAYNRTLAEINDITNAFNLVMPIGTQVVVKDKEFCFYDGFDYYPINEGFDTTIY